MSSPAAQILSTFASELGVSARAPKIPDDRAENLLVWEDDDDAGDFSSFPSLSIEESPGNYHTGVFHNRGDVESHVESLLSRPILLGKQQDKHCSGAGDEGDSLDEFFVESPQEVPKLMLDNFCTSFSTMMNSRLRAYANFLARHAFSHARCSKTEEEMEGVATIERKLDTMLGIGHQVTVDEIASEFTVDQEQCSERFDSDEATLQASMPLKMKISLDILLPHHEIDGGDETLKIVFETRGNICGIFSKQPKSAHQPLLLRVAELNLNMHELLSEMTGQASRIISCIVDMTNAAYAVPLPAGNCHEDCVKEETDVASTKQLVNKRKLEDDIYEGGDDNIELSPESCANIIDCVIGEIDDDVLSPHHQKKIKVLPSTGLVD